MSARISAGTGTKSLPGLVDKEFTGQTWDRHGTDMGQTWDRHGTDMGQTWDRRGTDVGQTWDRHGTDMGQTWDRHVPDAVATLCSEGHMQALPNDMTFECVER